MIARLSGTVVAVGATDAVVDLAGFGLLVQVTPETASTLHVGRPVALHTSLIVREDALTLYGFVAEAERDCFTMLLTASGVGPKLALAILSVLSPGDLREAVQSGDLHALTKVPGIGRKGAERIVLELRDKIVALSVPDDDRAVVASPTTAAWREQVTDGLRGLGWPARDAEAACDRVEHLVEEDPDISIPILMRAALRSLAK